MADLSDRLRQAIADRYDIAGEIGRGGMAVVYRAHDLEHDRQVAIKVLKPGLSAVLGAERFLREMGITARFNHPNIVPLLDSGQIGGLLYYVMPYVAGESLRERMDRDVQLPVAEALRITEQVSSALEYAHRQQVIHRDIKPENILLHEGVAMVADFGMALAVTTAGGERLTGTGITVGTPEYMSPEQATGSRKLDGRSDIYALGCVLYEMLTGEPPHAASTPHAVIAKRLTDPVTPARRLRGIVSQPIEQTLEMALAKVAANRFETAQDFAQALTAASADSPRPRQRRGWSWVLPVVAAAAALSALLLWLAIS